VFVVFESANPDFYLAHFDLSEASLSLLKTAGPSGITILMDTFIRLTKSPVVSIAKIRGRVRGVGSEVRARLRYALRIGARTRSWLRSKLGRECIPAAVDRTPPAARWSWACARGIVLGANDFDGETAERYGYVNRALPDDQLDAFVDVLARTNRLLRPAARSRSEKPHQSSLGCRPPIAYSTRFSSFTTALTWPESAAAIPSVARSRAQPAGRNGETGSASFSGHFSIRRMSPVAERKRCAWAAPIRSTSHYHDAEWGVPLHDDSRAF